MIKAWPFTLFLAVFSFIYGATAFLSDTPFFIGTESRKFKELEWIYTKLGPEFTGVTFLLLGAFLTFTTFKNYKNTEKVVSTIGTIFIVKIVVAIVIIGFLLVTAIV